jgi:hypothetical protein
MGTVFGMWAARSDRFAVEPARDFRFVAFLD